MNFNHNVVITVDAGVPMPTKTEQSEQFDQRIKSLKEGDSFFIPHCTDPVRLRLPRHAQMLGVELAAHHTMQDSIYMQEGVRFWVVGKTAPTESAPPLSNGRKYWMVMRLGTGAVYWTSKLPLDAQTIPAITKRHAVEVREEDYLQGTKGSRFVRWYRKGSAIRTRRENYSLPWDDTGWIETSYEDAQLPDEKDNPSMSRDGTVWLKHKQTGACTTRNVFTIAPSEQDALEKDYVQVNQKEYLQWSASLEL